MSMAWYDDVRQLWAAPSEFFPAAHHTDDQRLNAMVRLLAYCALAATFVSGNVKYAIMGVLAVAAVSLAHRGGKGSPWSYDGFANVPPNTVQRRTDRCSRPTYDNPFMNPTVGELAKNPNRPPACPYDEVAADVWKGFDQGLFKGVEDVYDVQNSQRQFYTVPVTTAAPDTIAFANYCYGASRLTCKESTDQCKPWFAARS